MNVTSLESYLRLTLIECLYRFAKTRLWSFESRQKQNGKTERTQDGVDILDFLGTVFESFTGWNKGTELVNTKMGS